jgi:L-fuconolactonase
VRDFPVVDAQIHLYAPGEAAPESLSAVTVRPDAWPETFGAGQAIAAMDKAGVAKAVVIPPTFVGDCNDDVRAAVRFFPDRFIAFGRVPLARVRRTGLGEWMASEPELSGLRLTFHDRPVEAIRDGSFDWLWRAAERLSVPVMIHAPQDYQAMAAIAMRFSGLRLAVDHLGLRENLTTEQVPDWLAAVESLTPFPNVSVKASCLVNYLPDEPPFPLAMQVIQRLVHSFGPGRVFWGSDLTRLRYSYAELVLLFRRALADVPKAAEDVLGGGILNWLGSR